MNVATLGGAQILNGFIGEAYFDIHNWDSALVYIQRAYDIDSKDTSYHWSLSLTIITWQHTLRTKSKFCKSN